MIRRAPACLLRFGRDRRANVATLFGVSAIPLIGLTGLGIDYGYMLTLKAKLDQSADAAAVTGANTAASYLSNYTGQLDVWSQAQAAGQKQATAQFQSNLGSLPAGTLSTITPNVQKTNTTITSTLNYSFQMKPFVMGVVGAPSMTVAGTSVSKRTLPTYVNIYVVIDTSGSMGIGATPTDQAAIADVSQSISGINSKCAFACHFPNQDSETAVRQKYKSPPVQLRIDAAKAAVAAGLKNIPTGSTYQVAILTLGNALNQIYPNKQTITPSSAKNSITLSKDITGAYNYVNNPNVNDPNFIDLANSAGTGGTDMTYALQSLASALPTAGDGTTSEKAQGIVMLITDAIQDSIVKNPSKPGDYESPNYRTDKDANFTKFNPCNQSNCYDDTQYMPYLSEMIFETFDPNQCTPIKNSNYVMMTLDVQYVIPDKTLQGSAIFEDMFAHIQNFLPSIAGTMSSCATTSGQTTYAYSANTPTEISAAVAQMFNAIPTAASVRLFQ